VDRPTSAPARLMTCAPARTHSPARPGQAARVGIL
jgi:hypothetical protein